VSLQTGGADVLDSDGDGLTDAQEVALGTCAAFSAKCPTPWDSDGDGYSDFLEVTYKTSGFDPLDPKKPATPCGSPGTDSDGDGLMDCEEEFLGTLSGNVDTDGDFLSDLVEVRNGMNPLLPADAFGDINRDGILNEAEIKMALSPTSSVSPEEKAFGLTYNFDAEPSNSASTGTCYNFLVQHLRLLTPALTPLTPEGYNRIYYDVYEIQDDSPTNFANVRRACADVLYVDGKVKVPLTGTVSFVNTDFVPIGTFSDANCKDLTKGVVDAGVSGGGVAVDGGTD
jgi:hypothetical protein